MASFPLKNAHFLTPVYSTPNLKMLPLHCIPEILYAKSIDTELIIRAKSFPLWPNALSTIHPLRTDRRTDGRETDDNGNVIRKARQKLCTVGPIGLIINVRERKFHANFDVENESSKTKVPDMKVPHTKVLGYESSGYQWNEHNSLSFIRVWRDFSAWPIRCPLISLLFILYS